MENPSDKKTYPIVSEEKRLLEKVQKAIDSFVGRKLRMNYDAELVKLRDELAEAKLVEDKGTIMEQMTRLAALKEAEQSAYQPEVDPDTPYFAHLKLQDDQRGEREILLGKQTFLHEGVKIIDWRHAPVSRIFYGYNEGEGYVEEIAGRSQSGKVLARRNVSIKKGKLVRVASPQGIYVFQQGSWIEIQPTAKLGGGEGSALRPDTTLSVLPSPKMEDLKPADRHLPEIAALLDSEQFDLLTHPGSQILIVAGSAGSGKTTVGLHRLAYLTYQDPERFRPKRMLVLVFGHALANYISQVLPALGVEGVRVQNLEEWVRQQKQRHFSNHTQLICQNTPAEVVRFKTHPMLIPWLEKAAHDASGSDPVELFDELFTNRGWLAQVGQGTFSEESIHRIHRWCTDQQFCRYEGGRTETEEEPVFDQEDGMILLRLHQLLLGPLRFRRGRKLSYDHLLVDEAQDFSPLELLVLSETVRESSMTLAGDPAQNISEHDFAGWEKVLETIAHQEAHMASLRISYRSTIQIMEFAKDVLGPLAPADPPLATRNGAPVHYLHFDEIGPAVTFLGDTLADLLQREPNASVALLTPSLEMSLLVHDALSRGNIPGLRLVKEGNFSFGPGVEVAEIASAKGLEFDYVVLMPVHLQDYPNTPQSRHLLHTGATRAIHQLWIMSWQAPSPVLPESILKAKIFC